MTEADVNASDSDSVFNWHSAEADGITWIKVLYDPELDAIAIAETWALSHTRDDDAKILIHILPRLSSDEIKDLQKEYSVHSRLHGKGLNMARLIGGNLEVVRLV